MKHLLFTLFAIYATFSVVANDYLETYNIVSDECVNSVQEVNIIRKINGGTVLIPEFDKSCPEELMGPFSHACRIVEEYLYPCLPIRIKVSTARLGGSFSNSLSKIKALSMENFGNRTDCNNAPMTMIKGVSLAEFTRGLGVSFLDSIHDVNFLIEAPDIEIVYNQSKFDEMSFTYETVSEEKYDFVSVAMRDILIGFGFASNFKLNPVTNGLDEPAQARIPFENQIYNAIGGNLSPVEKLAKATKGGLEIGGYPLNTFLTLYAPKEWENGVSLNYFIPQEDCALSQLLSYDFCKGMVFRSISDEYDSFVFYELLDWYPNILTGGGVASGSSGSTELLVPFNGSLTIGNSPANVIIKSESPANKSPMVKESYIYNTELCDYMNKFDPTWTTEGNITYGEMSVSILKKDGTWDVVKESGYIEGMPIYLCFSDWKLHFDDSEYARTIDGYLRARITKRYLGSSSVREDIIASTFFVVDYLPQKVGLTYRHAAAQLNPLPFLTTTTASASSGTPCILYFSDIEGVDRIVLERLREGDRLPSKIEVTDFRKGYYETTVDKKTTFTVVAYNKNGISRGEPITVSPLIAVVDPPIKHKDNVIEIEGYQDTGTLKCNILPLDPNNNCQLQSEVVNGEINIAGLRQGLYVVSIFDENNEVVLQYKFKK